MTDQLPDGQNSEIKAEWFYMNFGKIGWMDFVQTLQKKKEKRK